jgi:hypothetical protein
MLNHEGGLLRNVEDAIVAPTFRFFDRSLVEAVTQS